MIQYTLLEKFLKKIPKVELHIHIEATTSFKTYQYLNKKYKMNPSLRSTEDYRKFLNISSLSDMIKKFIYLQEFFKKPADFSFMVKDLYRYMVRNNICYAEVYFSPSTPKQTGHDVHNIYTVLTEEAEKIFRRSSYEIYFLIDISRTFGFDNAQQNLDDLINILPHLKHAQRIIGIGLGGKESGNPAKIYAPLFERARAEGLHIVAHAGEEENSQSIWEAIHSLHAERIGHATSAQFDAKLIEYLQETQIPLELCPTSNIITKRYVQSLSEHPLRQFLEKGLFVTLHTDDPLLFDIELIDEYKNVFYAMDVSMNKIIQIIKNTVNASFLSQEQKNKLLDNCNKVIKKYFPAYLSQ